MRVRGFFVTGTDTDIGKTHVAISLMRFLSREGLKVLGMKPVASGLGPRDPYNEDALGLQSVSSLFLPYEWVNPCLFKDPLPPHLAASQVGHGISGDDLHEALIRIARMGDAVVVEGAGGWLVPLGPGFDMADLAVRFGLPVILVVGIRLGCINHARLSDRAIRQSGVVYAGWVANMLDERCLLVEETISELSVFLGCAPLARFPFWSGEGEDESLWDRGVILRQWEP